MHETNRSPKPNRRQSVAARLFRLSGLALLPHWLRRLLAWTLWTGYFGLAVLILVLRYSVLPNIESYRGDIERAVSDAAGLKVSIASIDAHWQGLRPYLGLHGFQLHDKEGRPALAFDNVETEIAWSSLLHLQLRLHRLEINAPMLNIRREPGGHVYIAGLLLNSEAQGTDFSDWLLAQGSITVRNATIYWEDGLRGAPPLVLSRVNFVLQNNGSRHRFGITAEPPRELAARLEVRGDFRGADLDRLERWKGEAYAELDYADLAAWRAWVDYPLELPQGTGGLRLWLGFADKKLNAVTADIALRDVRLRLARELPMLDLASLDGRLSGRQSGAGLEVGAKKLSLATKDGIAIQPTDFLVSWTPALDRRPAHGEVTASGADLGALSRLAAFLPFDAAMRKALADYAPSGRLQDFRLGWSGGAYDPKKPPLPEDPPAARSESLLGGSGTLSSYTFRANFDGIGIKAQGYFPGFAGLSGSIEGNEKGGLLSLKSRNAALELPTVFADPRLDLEQLAAQANWMLKEGQLEVQLQSLSFNNRDAAGSASGRYRSVANGPGEIDLTARLSRGEGASVWRYMPLVVNRDVRDWLRASVSGGRASDAHLRLKGDLKDFPFADGKNGTFKVTAKFSGASLRYASDWPGIDNITGDLLFEGRRMLISASRGSIYGVSLGGVSAEIADLEAAEEILTVAGRASGPTGDFLRFIDASPVSATIDRFTEGMSATGDGSLALRLVLPLRKLDESKIAGDYRFLGNRLVVDPDLPPLTDVDGLLQFTDDGVSLKEARANLLDSPVSISASTRPDGAVAISANGSLGIAALRRNMDSRLLEHLSGSTEWRGSILVRKKSGAEAVFESGLQGISSSLPAPFNKTAAEILPLRIERGAFAEAPGREVVRLALGRALNAQIVGRREAGKVTVERGVIGVGETAALPDRGVLLSGTLESLNVDFWRQLLAGDGGASVTVTAVSLRAAEATMFDRAFAEVVLRASLADDIWQAQVSSREVIGDIAWKAQGLGRLRARLKLLALNESTPGKSLIAEEPLRELPGLDVVAENFTLRGKKLGRLVLQAANETGAWRIEKLAIANPDGALDADGVWASPAAGSGQAQGTQLNFRLDVSDTGKMLERLGYADAVRRGTARLKGKVSWSGAPTQIDYSTLGGSFSVDAAKGQFNKLEPGVGRLLGILSLQSLPRRITLDFRDIFSEGFAYDSITGNAKITRGTITTEDLRIEGPSARIFMKGSASIPAETQNLRVRVEPALGESVAVGAMLASPIVGAAAWVVQKVLKDPLGQIFAFEYAVTGSWSDPKVEKIQQGEAVKNEGQAQ